MVFVAALVLGGCGDDGPDLPGPTAEGVDLRAELLTQDDLPPGWQRTEGEPDDDYKSIGCLDNLQLTGPEGQAAAGVGFLMGETLLAQTLQYFAEGPAAQEAYSVLVSTFADCPTFTEEGRDGTIAEISFPRLGTESSAFALDLPTRHFTVLIARKADRLVHLVHGGFARSDPDDLEPIARVALDKVLG